MLGCGSLKAYIASRGGTIVAQLPSSSIDFAYILDDVSSGSVTVPLAGITQACCQTLSQLQPYKHELLITRDDQEAWVGIPSQPAFKQQEASITARDMFSWGDVRKVAVSRGFDEEDLATIFSVLFGDTLDVENSMGLTLSAGASGEVGSRIYRTESGRYVADECRELARSGLSFTTIGRSILVRPRNQPSSGLKLLGSDFVEPEPAVAGIGVGTEITVIGDIEDVAATVGGIDAEFGLVQIIVSEPRIRDVASALTAAVSYHDQARRPPQVLSGVLRPEAPVSFSQLIPGTVFEVWAQVGCREISAPMRLESVKVKGKPEGEEVDVTLVETSL